jgi:hypothetical protein
MKRKFRKLNRFNHDVEDDISKLEYILNISPKFRYQSQPLGKSSEKSSRKIQDSIRMSYRSNITEANETNLKALFQMYRKRFN